MVYLRRIFADSVVDLLSYLRRSWARWTCGMTFLSTSAVKRGGGGRSRVSIRKGVVIVLTSLGYKRE